MPTRTTRRPPSKRGGDALTLRFHPTRTWALWAIAAALSLPAAAGAEAPCRISEIREDVVETTTHIIVLGAQGLSYRSTGADSVVLELPGCFPIFDADTVRLSSPLLTSSSLALTRAPDAGSELDLRLVPGATYRLFESPEGVHFIIEAPAGMVVVPPPRRMEEAVPAEPTAQPTAAPAVEPRLPPEPEPATPSPSTVPAGPASRIVAIRAERRAGEIVITIDADGRIESYRDFRLPEPERVVVNLSGLTVGRAVPATLRVEALTVRAALFKRAPPIARVVVDLPTRLPYRIEAEGSSLSVVVATDGGDAALAR